MFIASAPGVNLTILPILTYQYSFRLFNILQIDVLRFVCTQNYASKSFRNLSIKKLIAHLSSVVKLTPREGGGVGCNRT